jgi:hypothetical protein
LLTFSAPTSTILKTANDDRENRSRAAAVGCAHTM